MKRLLVLILVLGLASITNAHFFFTLNGEPQPQEIWIRPSAIIELDLEVKADEKILCYDLAYILDNQQAEFIWDEIQFPTEFEFQFGVWEAEPQYVRIVASQFLGEPIPGPVVLMNELYLHCLEETDVVLWIEVADVTKIGPTGWEPLEIGEVLHTLIIHQIPEPASAMILGLGSLIVYYRRRR